MDFDFTFRTNDDMEFLFSSLATQLDSYRIKKGVVKSGRWFSWHNGCESQYHEFWATRMLLSFVYPNETDPDQNQKSFKEMRSGGDSVRGLRLVLQCCSWKTWYGITAIKLADQPLWTYYSESVKTVKDASHGFQRNLLWSGDGWMNAEYTSAGWFVSLSRRQGSRKSEHMLLCLFDFWVRKQLTSISLDLCRAYGHTSCRF